MSIDQPLGVRRYAGNISPVDTYAALVDNPDAVLVDCRTEAEWLFAGLPDLQALGRGPILVEWQTFPEGRVAPDFVQRLEAEGVHRDVPVYFICRSGARSKAAAIAATEGEYAAAYNVTDGFEGPIGAHGVRDLAGWKNEGLPWRQT